MDTLDQNTGHPSHQGEGNAGRGASTPALPLPARLMTQKRERRKAETL